MSCDVSAFIDRSSNSGLADPTLPSRQLSHFRVATLLPPRTSASHTHGRRQWGKSESIPLGVHLSADSLRTSRPRTVPSTTPPRSAELEALDRSSLRELQPGHTGAQKCAWRWHTCLTYPARFAALICARTQTGPPACICEEGRAMAALMEQIGWKLWRSDHGPRWVFSPLNRCDGRTSAFRTANRRFDPYRL
jgi:hypothetical protein